MDSSGNIQIMCSPPKSIGDELPSGHIILGSSDAGGAGTSRPGRALNSFVRGESLFSYLDSFQSAIASANLPTPAGPAPLGSAVITAEDGTTTTLAAACQTFIDSIYSYSLSNVIKGE
jgi:hypothetical protein